ncbi:unnamed protein product [Rhizophagus irregularis]|nr:unnamed protein product [Rhizophagus irregularis]
MSQYRPLLRRILGQFELNIEEWVKEIMWYLDIAYLKALDSEFSKENEMAIYERFSDIIKNFSEDKELAYALLDLVEILSKRNLQHSTLYDYNIQRIFTES